MHNLTFLEFKVNQIFFNLNSFVVITKKLFCEVMESLLIQINQDKEIGSFFLINSGKTLDGTCSYNNNRVIKSCVKLLHEYFPPDEDGFSELEHFLFTLEFGKPTKEGNETETFEQLYTRLINNL